MITALYVILIACLVIGFGCAAGGLTCVCWLHGRVR
jgi:hypothetical protein